jgi:DNA-binding CsgD family transcriptional regulator/tetratricopeptide (TPR) repeat protein
VVVGRDGELDMLRGAVRRARSGESSCVVLVGEGGVGKTRLLGEVSTFARQSGIAVLSGRVPIVSPAPFSVFTEALRSWLRGHAAPGPMAPFDRGLALVVPEWPVPDEVLELEGPQLHLLALEGIARLVAGIAEASGGAVVVLDDMHAADAASLGAMGHLVQAAIGGVSIVTAMRPGEAPLADELVRSLRHVGVADVVAVDPLDPRNVADLITALLDARPPDELVDDIVGRTDGVPLLVEEVVLAHVRAGTVEVRDGTTLWRDGRATVPRTIRELAEARLRLLDPEHRNVVVAGAVVGDFDPALMVAVAEADDAAVSDALAAGVRAGLLETSGGLIAFRHAIIREAVLDATVPHLVDTMHRRAAAALDCDDAADARRLERRAVHLRAVGATDEAALALVDAASAHVGAHASLPAEHAARGAVALATSTGARVSAADALSQSLATQGRWREALELDTATTAEHGALLSREERMAACAVEVGRPELAEEIIERVAAKGELSLPMRVTSGRAALVRGDAATALGIARAVADGVGAEDQDLRLAALDLEGRAHDYLGDREAAKAAWERQAREAEAAGRTQAQLRAVVQLGKVELFAGEPPNRMHEAVRLAREAGALVELGWAQENLAVALGVQGDVPGAVALLAEAVSTCRALRLDQLAYLLGGQAISDSYSTDEGVEEKLAEAEALMDTFDLRLHTTSIRADIALRAGRYEEAVVWLDSTREMMRSLPGAVPIDALCWRVWALAAAGRHGDAEVALEEARQMPDLARWYGRPVVVAAGAALLEGDADGVDRAIAAAPGIMPMDIALMRLVGADVIGGEARVRWLRQALDTYEKAGAPLAADRVRQALRDAGGPVPRRRRRTGALPDELASAGVTAREADVLRLVGDGLPNAEIAQRLYVSVRTVEAHVSSLLTKLQARNRAQLATVAARAFA